MTTVLRDGLTWDQALGRGYYPVEHTGQYDRRYWCRYATYTGTVAESELNRRRVDLVEKHAPGADVVDIGIGCGHFILAREALGSRAKTLGYDINLEAVRWLVASGLWHDPWAKDPEIITCWDSLEHLSRPEQLVSRVRRMVIVSIPIFTDLDHVMRSKHFRKDEHYWYFTRDGLLIWMEDLGFQPVEENRMEQEAGREDIGTFVFARPNVS